MYICRPDFKSLMREKLKYRDSVARDTHQYIGRKSNQYIYLHDFFKRAPYVKKKIYIFFHFLIAGLKHLKYCF